TRHHDAYSIRSNPKSTRSSSRASRSPVDVLLPLVVALVPLVIASGFLFYFDITPKVVLLMLGAAAALPWFAPRKLLARREGRWFLAVCAVQAFSLALSTVFSSRVGLSVFGTNWRRFGLITQLALVLFTIAA